MSKILEKLERASEGRVEPLGFGHPVERDRPMPVLLVAGIPDADRLLIDIASKAGLDAVLVTARKLDLSVLERMRSTGLEVPWGLSLDILSRHDLAQIADAGADFVIFPPENTPASVLNEEEPGKVLRIDPGLDENLARTIQRLSVDAVLIGHERKKEALLSIQDLMLLERIAGLTGKHMLAELPALSPLDDIESLWSIGVRGLVLDMSGKDPEGRISQVQEAARKLPRTRKDRGRRRATLPAMREVEPEPEEEEDWRSAEHE